MKKNNKRFKTGGIIVITLLLITVIAIVAINIFLTPYLEKRLRNTTQKFGNVEYKLEFSLMSFQVLGANLYLNEVEIIPMKSQDSLSNDNYTIVIDKLKIEGFDLLDYFMDDKIEMNNVQLDNCHLVLYRYKKTDGAAVVPETEKTVVIKSVEVKNFEFNNGSFKIIDVYDDVQGVLAESNFSMKVKRINYVFGQDTVDYFDYGNVTATLSNVKTNTPDSLRTFTVENIQINGKKKSHQAKFKNISLATRLSKYKLAETLGHESDWMDLSIPTMEITQWQLVPLLLGQSFFASEMHIVNPTLNVFRDKRYPFPETKDSELPTDFMKTWKYKFAIDSISIKNATITYQEHVKAIDEPGEINFTSLYATIFNMTNDSATFNRNGTNAYMSTQTNVMGAPLKAEFTFPLASGTPNSVKGSLGAADLTVFNPMLSRVGYAKVKSGKCHAMDFNFTFDDARAQGELIFLYDDLEIETISRNDGDDDSFGQNLKTFLADFIVDDENRKDDLRKGEINFERNKKKSLINYWWKAVLTGIKSSIGMKGEVPHNND